MNVDDAVRQLIAASATAVDAALLDACKLAAQSGRTQLVAHPGTYIDPTWLGDRTVIRCDELPLREVIEVTPEGAELALRRVERP